MTSPSAIVRLPRRFHRSFPTAFLVALLTSGGLPSPCDSVAIASPLRDREASLRRRDWFWSSVPPGRSALLEDHARVNWYTPKTQALERDLDPTLTVRDGAEDVHPVMELSIRPPDSLAAMDGSDWTGIVQAFGVVGIDLSGLQAVEIWVNDFRHDHSGTGATLRLALGRFSEDAFWDSRHPPNGVLDTEDRNQDGRLNRTDPSDPSYLIIDEDTGLDGIHDVQEPGYTGPGSDPNQDDYRYNPFEAPEDYSHINNTEFNDLDDPNARPDTEDLNQDGGLDIDEDSFEVSLDLADTAFVRADVPRDHPTVAATNGWRRFVVPVSAFAANRAPNWSQVAAVRLVFEELADSVRLQIGGIRFVGVPAPPAGSQITLHQNRPNPFNPATMIEYELSRDEPVRLDVFNVGGRRVATLVDRMQTAGSHRVTWSGRDDRGVPAASGVYLYRLRTSSHEATRRMVLVK